MEQALIELGLFTAKSFIIFFAIVAVLVVFFALLSRGKDKAKGHLIVKNLNHKYEEMAEALFAETKSKKQFKKYIKERKSLEKTERKSDDEHQNVYVLNFHGDIKASAVSSLSEEVTAILNVATPSDEVILRLESPGGMVPGYGLAAAQLMRIRARGIKLTVAVDKVAASGGYMMACVANQILAAPFAIVGSIGVIVQLPNFHRLLKDKHIDFEQIMAGEFKRTLTLFGENTDEGREKLHEEIEEVHQLFKNLITEHRRDIDIQRVATGEHWYGVQALALRLVDEIKTSEDYLLERSKDAKLFEVSYEMKKPLLARLTGSASILREKLFNPNPIKV